MTTSVPFAALPFATYLASCRACCDRITTPPYLNRYPVVRSGSFHPFENGFFFHQIKAKSPYIGRNTQSVGPNRYPKN